MRKIKHRIEKKRKHIELKWRRANKVFALSRPIRYTVEYLDGGKQIFRVNPDDITAIQAVVYTAQPRSKHTWGVHWRDAPRTIDYREAWRPWSWRGRDK